VTEVDSYNIADAKAQFSDLVERAEAGEEIEIKRRGQPVAKIVPIQRPKKRLDVEAMRRIAAMSPPTGQSTADFIREMRDSDRF